MVAIATSVNRNDEIKAGLSPKFSMPMARAPRMTVKFSHERKVRSLAKKTLGSTRVGRAIRLPFMIMLARLYNGGCSSLWCRTWSCLEERLARHRHRNGPIEIRERNWCVEVMIDGWLSIVLATELEF